MKFFNYTFGIIFLSLFLVACSPTQNGNTTDNSTDPETQPTAEADVPLGDGGAAAGAMLAGSNAIFMNPQMPGTEIKVTTVLLQEPGFVVIHRSENGQVGEVVGASKLLITDSVEATLTLDEAVEDGEILIAMLHKDDGNGVYDDAQTDAPILDETTNSPVQMEFEISETADQQPIMMP